MAEEKILPLDVVVEVSILQPVSAISLAVKIDLPG